MSEPFEPSPFMPGGMKSFEDELNLTSGGQQSGQPDQDASVPLAQSEKESTKENNVAKIKVVVCGFYWQLSAVDVYCLDIIVVISCLMTVPYFCMIFFFDSYLTFGICSCCVLWEPVIEYQCVLCVMKILK